MKLLVEGHSPARATADALPDGLGPWTPQRLFLKGGKWKYEDGDVLNVVKIEGNDPTIITIELTR